MTSPFNHKSFAIISPLIYLVLSLIGGATYLGAHANAQSSMQIKFSYEAKNYAPMEYLTRVGAPITPNSQFRVSVLIWQEMPAGNVLLKSPQEYVYQWYFNNRFISQGRGENAINLVVPPAAIAPQEIHVVVEDLRGRRISAVTHKIPLAAPEIGIFERISEEVYSGINKNQFLTSPGSQITVIAKPFFFTAMPELLLFKWTHMGLLISNPAQKPHILPIKIADSARPGQQDNFAIEISNPQNQRETARRTFTIYTQ